MTRRGFLSPVFALAVAAGWVIDRGLLEAPAAERGALVDRRVLTSSLVDPVAAVATFVAAHAAS